MNSELFVLSLETATLGGSVFLGRGGVQLATRCGDPAVSQSASLLSDVNDVLTEAGISLSEVDLFACASGPGSFTGLRIGIATLKGLAASLKLPCIGVPTLHAVAHAAGRSRATVALLPAGRGEVFAQRFSVDEDGTVIELDAAAHLSPRRLAEKYGSLSSVMWAGSGAHAQRDFLEQLARDQGIDFSLQAPALNAARNPPPVAAWILAAKEANLAKHVASLALAAFQSGTIQYADSLRAIYVRPSDAELNQQCR